jgi:DNA polymerase elongation subunit (family B)
MADKGNCLGGCADCNRLGTLDRMEMGLEIEHEAYLDYIMFVKEENRAALKKNYVYVTNGKLTVMGLPIKKSNASLLGPLILEKYLKEQIIKNLNGKFNFEYIKGLIIAELSNNIFLYYYILIVC